MRNVPSLTCFAQAVTFDRLGKNYRRLSLVFDGRLVSRVNFAGVVPSARHLAQLLVAQVNHALGQLRIFAEEMFPNVAAALDDVFLKVAIDALFESLQQQAIVIVGEQFVPVGTPDHFDDVPACATERAGPCICAVSSP